jgi:mRNA interferase HigB
MLIISSSIRPSLSYERCLFADGNLPVADPQRAANALDKMFAKCEHTLKVHVISKKRLREFAARHADAEEPLKTWNAIAETATWRSIADVRLTYPHADFVDPLTVFNIKGNTYRLIVKIEYRFGRVYIKHFLTHAEYDKGEWT